MMDLSVDASGRAKRIFNMVGFACLLVSIAWIVQAVMFSGTNARAAEILWIISSAVIAGIGAGFVLAAFFWLRTSP